MQMGIAEAHGAPRTDGVMSTRDLTPYVPRLVVEWLRSNPEADWRNVDGTMAFVDISGFTALSERLAREGKAGAEQVTDVMNGTFEALLEVAYAAGGGLLKFGGDALLLFFDGPRHAVRAAHAAHAMRRTLRSLRPRTTAGAVTLRMHVGIHSGAFSFFLVGGAHRELIVCGPAATATVEMEAAAEAGEIVVSAATAALLPAATLGEGRAGGRLLVAAPRAPRRLELLEDTTALPVEACVPPTLREVAGVAEPEHRQATVAFVRFSGADAIVAVEGASAAAEAVAELVEAVQAAADAHGVCFLESDIDRDGARIVLVAGAPRTTEADEERMLRTVRAVVERGTRLPVSIGVSRGRVFAGEVGASFRRTYTILGKTAALAARLMARAEPRQVLAAADVVERSRTTFETRALEPFLVKGRDEPVEAADVGAIAGTVETRPARRVPLVGRQRELAVLTASLAPVRMSFGTFVELVGEAGVGKSRLVDEVREAAADLIVLGAQCDQYEQGTAYFVFRSILRELVEVEADGSPAENTAALSRRLEAIAPELIPWIPLLALPLDIAVEPTREVDDLQPAFRRARLHGVVESLLDKLLPSPSLVVLEDVHWIDEASSELLRHLGTQCAKRPWALFCTRRPGDAGFVAAAGMPPVAAMTIHLEPLHADEARELVAASAERSLVDADVTAIVDRAGGNPLFLQELVATTGAEADELPETVDAVVAARIDKLVPTDRALLRWASVVGVAFEGALLDEVLAADPSAASDDDAWERLSEYIARDPHVPGGFRFRHALIRDAAYEGLPFRRRRELHARVGEAYERRASDPTEIAELLSLHFSLGGDAPRTWQHSLLAGARAKSKFANTEAAAFYRRALEAAHRLEIDAAERATVWESLAEVSTLAGRLADAVEALANARRLAPPAAQASLMLKDGLVREETGDYSGALRWYGRAVKALAGIPDDDERARLAVAVTRARAQARFRQGRYDEALDLAGEVTERALDLGDLSDLAHAYYLTHVIHTMRGDPRRSAFRGLALPIYEEIGDLVGQASVLNNLGIEAYYEGRWDEARDLYERSRRLRERIGDQINVATTANNMGEIDCDQGRYADAEARFREALAIADAAGHRLIGAVARGNLGRAAARAGRYDEAETLLSEAALTMSDIGSTPFVLELDVRRAELLALRADSPAEAVRLVDEALARGGVPPALEALLERIRGSAFAQSNDAEAARAALRRAVEIARRDQVDYEAALALRTLAELDLADDVEAAAIFERLGVGHAPIPRLH